MDRTTQQMDLDFGLMNTSSLTETNENLASNSNLSTSAVVISLSDRITKRTKEQQATIYRQITSSISHLL